MALSTGNRPAAAVDRWQRRHFWPAFPVAVAVKFRDDRAHNLAALVAYFAFMSLFPLLLVLVTVLDIALRGDPALRHRVLTSALGQFPVLGGELSGTAHGLRESGIALVVGLAGAVLGGCGVAAAAQNALNAAWLVPYDARPRFPWSLLRNLAFVAVTGLGLIATTALSAAGLPIVALAVDVALFWAAFRLGTARTVTSRELLPGALVAAVAWQALQLLGGFLVAHILARSSALYGVFGVVLGFLTWLYLQAQVTLVAIEIDVVRARGLWPRGLLPPLTAADLTAYRMYARVERRRRGIDIEIADDRPGG